MSILLATVLAVVAILSNGVVHAGPPKSDPWPADDPTVGLEGLFGQDLVDECGKRLYYWAHHERQYHQTTTNPAIEKRLAELLGWRPEDLEAGEPIPKQDLDTEMRRFIAPFLAYSVTDKKIRDWASGRLQYGRGLPVLADFGVPPRKTMTGLDRPDRYRLVRNPDYDDLKSGAAHAKRRPIEERKEEHKQAALERLAAWHRFRAGLPPLKNSEAQSLWKGPEHDELLNMEKSGALAVASNEDQSVIGYFCRSAWGICRIDSTWNVDHRSQETTRALIYRHSDLDKPLATSGKATIQQRGRVWDEFIYVVDADTAHAMVNSSKVIVRVEGDSQNYTFTMSGSDVSKAREYFNRNTETAD